MRCSNETDALGAKAMRVLIVDDHPIVASGCRTVLADEPEIVLLEAADAESAERVFIAEHPDICVIDINLPTVSGFELARRILAHDASARIIMFSMNDDPVFVARAIEIGAKGYVSKTGDPQDLVEAIREVGKGGVYLPPAIARSIAFAGPGVAKSPLSKLNAREMEILRLLSVGQKPVRDRLAGALALQDGRQHLLDHPPEARRADLRRAGAACDRERRVLTLRPECTHDFADLSLNRSHGGMQGVYRHASRETRTDMTFSVFVPAHRDGAKLPVVWYLSGLTCTHANVTEKGEFRGACAEHGLIFVAPDTSPRGEGVPGDPANSYDFGLGAGFYVDATRSAVRPQLPHVELCHRRAAQARRGAFSGRCQAGNRSWAIPWAAMAR